MPPSDVAPSNGLPALPGAGPSAGPIASDARSRRHRLASAAWTVGILLGTAGAAWAGLAWAARDGTASCSWPLRVRGPATAQQAGLVRCYLRALARRDVAGLYAVAQNISKVRITATDLAYSADARAGLATARFSPSSISTSYAAVTITYADGTVQRTGILNMAAMGGPSTWRITIGSNG